MASGDPNRRDLEWQRPILPGGLSCCTCGQSLYSQRRLTYTFTRAPALKPLYMHTLSPRWSSDTDINIDFVGCHHTGEKNVHDMIKRSGPNHRPGVRYQMSSTLTSTALDKL